MPDYNLLVDEFAASDLGTLFHQPAFFRLHAGNSGRYFQWTDGREVVGVVHFTEVEPGVWRSPARGTFAGYAWSQELPVEQLFAFHDRVEAELARAGARRVEVLPAPMAHDPAAFSNALYLLRARGFKMETCDLNHALTVSGVPLAERMTYGNRKRLRKAEREGYLVARLGLERLPAVYDAIAANRAGKGNEMSMRLSQLEEMAALFPDRLVLFGMAEPGAQDEQLAASAVCLRLSPSVLYVFYWGDRPGYAALSPVVALAEAIYGYCQAEKVALFDVGTSTIDHAPNHGLIGFKRGLGFTETLKVRMAKRL
ncbi:GNAT family N-acetyltransferase [Sphingomonas sp. CROZ-RG-20F-R02-07]|uniref:GNAT family N-acetyltransferase n=1 Tax=Sphingomonas sp. CROZ-RG-20F-R02-07 TaxID=2914832 RepID=UPI001F5865F7|nr:GNAT family N-acetyltransferase [Sphingomonas sp. CROZ-RG-20F-R02-07]